MKDNEINLEHMKNLLNEPDDYRQKDDMQKLRFLKSKVEHVEKRVNALKASLSRTENLLGNYSTALITLIRKYEKEPVLKFRDKEYHYKRK